MRRINLRALFVAVILVTLSVPASATAIYDYSAGYGFTFSSPWTTAATVYMDEYAYGTGFYTATTSFQSSGVADNTSWMQLSRITGSAGGNAALYESGTSHARNTVASLLTFDFGADSVNLVITCTTLFFTETLSFGPVSVESIDGARGSQLLFDNNLYTPQLQRGDMATFSNLTGQHTFRILTGVVADAEAAYGVPDVGSSLLLLGIGLAGLSALGRRLQ